MRYYNYPKIDNDFWFVTSTPNPLWTLGFTERIILALDRYLLDIISQHNEEYVKLLNDSRNILLYHQNSGDKVITGEMIQLEKEKNLIKDFKPEYLIFQKKTIKEIREGLYKLLNEKP